MLVPWLTDIVAGEDADRWLLAGARPRDVRTPAVAIAPSTTTRRRPALSPSVGVRS